MGPSQSKESMIKVGWIGLNSSSVSFSCQGTRLFVVVKAFGVPLWRERRPSGFGPGTLLMMRMGYFPAMRWMRDSTVMGLSSAASMSCSMSVLSMLDM